MSSEVKRYWPEEIVGTGELVVYLQDYAALEAECGRLRAALVEQLPVGEMISNDGDIYWADRHPPMGTKLYAAPIAQTAKPAVQEPYPHGHPLHKAVFMARESYIGGETFEEGVRGLIAELKDARKAQSEVQMLREALEHIREYWNRDQNESAMADALWHILEAADAALAASTGQEK